MEGKWTKLKLLGSGSFGKVFLATRIDDFKEFSLVAVKSADVQYAVNSLKLEGRFLAQLYGQPNIVQCFGEDISVENGRAVYNQLLEYAAGGSLHNLIQNTYNCGRIMSEFHIACYASMLLRGLAGIHAQGIAHCDLKPANILVFPVRGGMSQLKIADFGLARRVSEKEKVRVWDGRKSYNRGTLLYSSPESVAKGLHETCTDIWALGCIVVEMITGKCIWKYKDRGDLFDQILGGSVDITRCFSKDGIDFVNRCLERNPLYRWSAMELLDHPFIVNNLILSEICKVDLNREGKHFQKNPFGVRGWVSKRHLFTTWIWEALRQQQRQQQLRQLQQPQQQQFPTYELFPVQRSHQLYQIPCGAAAIAELLCSSAHHIQKV